MSHIQKLHGKKSPCIGRLEKQGKIISTEAGAFIERRELLTPNIEKKGIGNETGKMAIIRTS